MAYVERLFNGRPILVLKPIVSGMGVRFWSIVICACGLYKGAAVCQELKPGVPGMAPSKWITIKNTQAPGRIYQCDNSSSKTYTQEDIYFKAWIPLFLKPRVAIIAGPHYRTEQLELSSGGDNPLTQLSHWHLRSAGLDLKSSVKVDSMSWWIFGAQINQSGSLRDQPLRDVPLAYTVSAFFLRKRSINREVGFGVMVNKNSARLSVLPIFVYNYNYGKKAGIEIGLPHKIAWRYNATEKDIITVKGEAITRSYYIGGESHQPELFRRIEADFGVAYNRQLNRLVGVELFGGYRRNISLDLPTGVTPIKTSGMALSIELYMKPPSKMDRYKTK